MGESVCAQRPRPVADLGGIDRRRRAAQHARPRAAGRRARLSPLLGGRAPRRRRCSPAPSPEVLIGPIAAANDAHPRRQRRRDAAALQPAQGGRDVQHARRPVPGPHRPRHRPRAGTDPHDDASRCSATAARPPPDDFPEQLAELLGLPRATGCRGPPVRAARRAARAARARPSRGCSAPRRRARIWAAELGLPYAFADFINPERRGDRRAATASASRPPAPRGAAAWPSACGRSAPTPTRRRSAWPSSARMAIRAAAPRPADRRARRRRRRCATSVRGRGASTPTPPRRGATVVGSPQTVRAPGSRRSPRSTAPRR